MSLNRIFRGQVPPGLQQAAAKMGEDKLIPMLNKASAEMMYKVHGVPLPNLRVRREDKIPRKKCYNCEEFFTDRVNQDRHYRIMHGSYSISEQRREGMEPWLECKDCEMEFIYDEDFEKHNMELHVKAVEQNHKEDTQTQKVPLSKNQKKKLQKKRKSQKNAIGTLKTNLENLRTRLVKLEVTAAADPERKEHLMKELDSLKLVVQEKITEMEDYDFDICACKDEAKNQVTKIWDDIEEKITEETTKKDVEDAVLEVEKPKDNVQNEPKKKCRNGACSGAGLQRCSRCRSVSYCSEACSWTVWGDHKEECDEGEKKRMRKKLRKEKRLLATCEVD